MNHGRETSIARSMSLARITALGLALPLTACSHFSRIAAGPALRIGDAKTAGGAAVIAETVAGGTSESDVFSGAGVGARASLTSRSFELAPFVGPYIGESAGKVFVDASLRFGPGIQIVDEHALGLASAGAALGFGYAISDSGWRRTPYYPPNPWGIEPLPRMPPGGPDFAALVAVDNARRREERSRSRVLVTFGIGADAEARFTRSPSFSLSALIGVAWLDEVK